MARNADRIATAALWTVAAGIAAVFLWLLLDLFRPGHCDRDRSLVGQLSQLRAQQRSFATRRAAILRLGLALAGMRIAAGSGERSRPHRGMIVGS